MYICNYCNAEFYFPFEIKEVHGECPELPFESFYECPLCKSDDIEEKEIF